MAHPLRERAAISGIGETAYTRGTQMSGLALQLGVQPGRGLAQLLALRAAEVGELRLLQRRQAWVGVAHAVGDGQQEVPLDAPVGHLDEGPLGGVHAHQVGLGVLPFDPGADGPGFGQHAPVVEFQRGDARQRTLGAEGGALVFLGVEVDVHQFDAGRGQVDALFGQEHLHPARVGGARRHIEFHGRPPLRLWPRSGPRACAAPRRARRPQSRYRPRRRARRASC